MTDKPGDSAWAPKTAGEFYEGLNEAEIMKCIALGLGNDARMTERDRFFMTAAIMGNAPMSTTSLDARYAACFEVAALKHHEKGLMPSCSCATLRIQATRK